MIGPRHVESISEALSELLGSPARGDVAFVRCLPSNLVDALIDGPAFSVPGWTVRAVVDAAGPRRITADQAVEQREDKADPALLLIDPQRAGAGLDGVYSAAREIGESELFSKAQERARKRLWGRGHFLPCRTAARRATGSPAPLDSLASARLPRDGGGAKPRSRRRQAGTLADPERWGRGGSRPRSRSGPLRTASLLPGCPCHRRPGWRPSPRRSHRGENLGPRALPARGGRP